MSDQPYRSLTDPERQLVERLLRLPVEEHERLLNQLDSACVRTRDLPDNYGSIEFERPRGSLEGASHPIADGEAYDIDGVPIEVILFAAKGQLVELEVFKADGSPITRMPDPKEFDAWLSSDFRIRIRPKGDALDAPNVSLP